MPIRFPRSPCIVEAWRLLTVCWLAQGAAVAEPARPNILFAIADDWSYGHASALGASWVETPHFDRVAEEGLLFHRAFTPNAKCAPSRAIILTGRYSWRLEEAANHICEFPSKYGGFVERLASAGYQAGYTGKGWGPGRALDASGKPRAITGKNYNARKAPPPTRAISANDYAANFADFLQEAPQDKPWVFWCGTTEPHRGYEWQSGLRAGKKLSDIERVPSYWPDNEIVRTDMLDYAVEVEHFDTHLGRILQTIEEAGQLDNTLVVVTADHGMPFPRVKGQAYYHSNHIPLAMRWPLGIAKPGREIEDFVNFTDLAPTFLEVAGIEELRPIMMPTDGYSLTNIFRSEKDGQVDPFRDHVLIGKERHDIGRPNDWGYPIRGILQGDWLYLENFENDRWPAGDPITGYLNCDASPTKTWILDARRDASNVTFWDLNFGKRPSRELYNIASDPDCVVNVAIDDDRGSQVEALRNRMMSELKAQGDPRVFGAGAVFDEYVYINESTRGFYERYRAGETLRAGWVSPGDFETETLE